MAIIDDGSNNLELTGEHLERYLKTRFPKYYDEKYMVTSVEEELVMRIEWLLKGLDEISKYCNHNKEMRYVNSRVHNHFSEIEDKVKSIINGEN